MTRESTRPSPGGRIEADIELLALLWEEAPFPKLPRDAPPELKEFVQTIENPRHVYTIHCAARRHNFQTLVEKYVDIKISRSSGLGVLARFSSLLLHVLI